MECRITHGDIPADLKVGSSTMCWGYRDDGSCVSLTCSSCHNNVEYEFPDDEGECYGED